MKKKIGVILTIILWGVSVVFAHPGRTDSNGCHTCKTNCEKYGLEYGEYHCHDGSSSTTNSSTNSSNKKTTTSSSSTSNKTTTFKKSSDVSLKKVKLDGKEIDIEDETKYTTDKERVSLTVTARDEDAELEYDKNVKLDIGENEIDIKVTAEDGTVKTYTITVIRDQEEVIPVISENIKESEEIETTEVIQETEEEGVTFGDVVVTGGVCGLGYLGYKKYKSNKKR